MQGAQILRSETYLELRRNDEGCSAIPIISGQMDFLRSHHSFTSNQSLIFTALPFTHFPKNTDR
jgi:hypothetical protein